MLQLPVSLLKGACNIIILVGESNHKQGFHEYNAGAILIKKCLLSEFVCSNGSPGKLQKYIVQTTFVSTKASVCYEIGVL